MVFAVFEPASPAQQQEIAASGAAMGNWIDETIAARRGTDGDDLISVLLRAGLDGGALTHNEMRGFVFTLLVAGSITTAYLIGNATAALIDHPALLERVRRDPSLLGAVVEESLRHDSPAQIMFRTATRSVEISGSSIPEGATVLALLGAANRDHDIFIDPDRYDPTRDTRDHIAFGHGVHFCLGAALARLEARVALEELLAVAPRLERAGETELVASIVFRGPARLPIRTR